MKQDIVEYYVISFNQYSVLENEVNDLLKKGWQPLGGLSVVESKKCVSGAEFFQPMVRYGSPKKASTVSTDKQRAKTNTHNSCKEIFLRFYTEKNGAEYHWMAKDAGNLNKLISALSFTFHIGAHSEVGKEQPYTIMAVFTTYINKAHQLSSEKSMRYLMENFNISTLYSMYNDLIRKMKNSASSNSAKGQFD